MKSHKRIRASEWKTKAVAKVKDRVSSLAASLKEGVKPLTERVFFKNKCLGLKKMLDGTT